MRCLVYINGEEFTNWQSVSVSRSLDKMCGTFNIGAVYDYGTDSNEDSPFEVAGLIEVFYLQDGEAMPYSNDANTFYNQYSSNVLPQKNDATKILTGWIDKVVTQISEDGLQVNITGRDITCDLVDCTIESDTLEWLKVSISDIVNEWCKPFGIKTDIQTTKKDEIIDAINPNPDQKVADAMVKYLARKKGFLILTDEYGKLVLEDKGGELVLSPLRLGGNVIDASYTCDYSKRYSSLKVLNQQDKSPSIFGNTFSKSADDDGASEKTSGIVYDDTIERHRPVVVQPDGNSGNTTCESEASWRMKMSQASSYTLSAKVNGWTGASGDVWKINREIYCELEDLNLPSGNMLIKSVNFTLDSGGTFTNMELIHTDAYSEYNKNKTGKGNKKENIVDYIRKSIRGE